MSQISSLGFSTPASYSAKSHAGITFSNDITNQASSATSGEKSTKTTDPSIQKKDYANEFLDYMKKSPAERMREEILKSMGLTEDDLAKKPPAERKAIEDKIAEIIKNKLNAQSQSSNQSSSLQTPATAAGTLSDGVKSTLLQLQEINNQSS